MEPPGLRQLHQRFVRRLGPQEIRQPRRQRAIVDAVVVAGSDCRRLRLDPEKKMRAGEHGLQREADSRFEIAVLPSLLVELHQVAQVGVGHAAAIGLLREVSDDGPRAGNVVGRRGRSADENAFEADARRHARRPERPFDRKRPQVGHDGQTLGVADVEIRERVGLRRDQIVDRPFCLLDERGRHPARTRLHVNRVGFDRESLRHRLAHARVDVQQRDLAVVDRNLDAVGGRAQPEETATQRAEQPHLESVLPVGREDVHDRESAARPQRRACHGSDLRHELRHVVGDRGRRGLDVADGEPADLARGIEIALNERRRKTLDGGDVVEVVAQRVRREPLRHVDVEAEERPDRARVLGAVQTLGSARAGMRMEAGVLVDPFLERNDERVDRALVRTLRRVLRRHHPGTQLRQHPLREIGVAHDFLDRQVLERHAAGFPAIGVTLDANCPDHRRLRRGRHPIAVVWERDDRRGSTCGSRGRLLGFSLLPSRAGCPERTGCPGRYDAGQHQGAHDHRDRRSSR